MDVFAHALWTNAVFYKNYTTEKASRYWAIFFGLMPDLLSFTPAFFFLIFSRSHFGIETFNSGSWMFRYASWSYNWTHSFVTFAVVMLIVTIIRRGKVYWPLWGWALHIAIDVFTHKGFYETPLLYPLSGYKFDHGTSWGHPLFMVINYSLIALVYLFWFFVLRKKAKQNDTNKI